MWLTGKLKGIKGTEVTIRLDDAPDLLRLRQLSAGRQPSVQIDVADGRSISPDQRKKAWALINDFAWYTGYSPLEMEQVLKANYMALTGTDYFSMANTSMENAAGFIASILDYGFDNGIPWQLKNMDAIPDDYPLMMQCLKHRVCVICGKRAEIDHEPPIGRGYDRNHIDNRRFKFFPLCHTHHMIRHTRGIDWFMDFYHIKPVKLDEDTIVSLHLNSRKQLRDFDEGRN
jgi:hypothetical protein